MPKDSTLTLRIDAQSKQRIAAAARRKGRNLTGFVLETVLNSVRRSEGEANRKTIMTPAHFGKLCRAAWSGGEGDYFHVGHELMTEIERWKYPGSPTLERSLLSNDSTDEDVFNWFAFHLYRYARMIPRRRTTRFVEGVRKAFKEARATLS
jgi:hypothetical protein